MKKVEWKANIIKIEDAKKEMETIAVQVRLQFFTLFPMYKHTIKASFKNNIKSDPTSWTQ